MPTLDQLKRQGRVLANKCFLCEKNEETIDHLLFRCKKTNMLYDIFLSIDGTSWVFLGLIIQILLSWQGASMGKKDKNIWLAVLFCLF